MINALRSYPAQSEPVSIRAYGAQKAFKAESYRRIDEYTRTSRIFYDLNRYEIAFVRFSKYLTSVCSWVGFRVDGLAGVFTAILAAYMVYGPGHERVAPSDIGFSLNMAGECIKPT